jgi:O-antigen/teichoic acid export membrane protein
MNQTGAPPTSPARPLAWLGKGTWGLADQMLISLSNFVTMVLLARGLGLAEFGAFVLVYTVLQFANSMQGALFVQPHSVLGATRRGQDYASYTATTAVGQVLFLAAVALLVLAAAMLAQLAGWGVAPLLLALSPAVAAWQLQEFVRRVLYTEARLPAVVLNDGISYGGQALLIAVLWWRDALNGPIGLYSIAGTSTIAGIVGGWQLRRSLCGRIDVKHLVENWRYGKWLVGAEVGYWLSSQIYLYLSGILLGKAAAGTLKAAYVIFGPTRVIGFFLRTVLPTWFARTLAADGLRGMHRQLKDVYLLAAPPLALYSGLVAVFASPLLSFLYGPEYAGQALVVALYAAFAWIAFMSSIVAAALKAQRRTKYIFTTQMCALSVLPLGWGLIEAFGTPGAVGGMIATSLVVNLMYWRAYLRQLLAATRHDAPAIRQDAATLSETPPRDPLERPQPVLES